MTWSKEELFKRLGGLVYALGALLGLVFICVVSWGNLEASYFNQAVSADEALKTLRCPVFITRNETSAVTVSITNPTNELLKVGINTMISGELVSLPNEYRQVVSLGPLETKIISQPINAANATWQYLVVARVERASAMPLKDAVSSCGVVMLPLSIGSGNLWAVLWALACLALLAGGGLWWYRTHQPLNGKAVLTSRGLTLLGAALLLGIGLCALGVWGLGILLSILCLLLGLAVLSYNLNPS